MFIMVMAEMKQHLKPLSRPQVPKPNFPVYGALQNKPGRYFIHLVCLLLRNCMREWVNHCLMDKIQTCSDLQ